MQSFWLTIWMKLKMINKKKFSGKFSSNQGSSLYFSFFSDKLSSFQLGVFHVNNFPKERVFPAGEVIVIWLIVLDGVTL